MTAVETHIQEMHKNHLPHIHGLLDEIKQKLSTPRPSWFVTLLFAAMSSTIVGFLVHGVVK